MVLGKLPMPGRFTIWMIVGQGATALVLGAGGGFGPKIQNRRAALGRPTIKITGGASTSLRSTNPRP